MTPFKNFNTQSTWKRSLRRGGMYVAVAALLSGQAACGSDNGADWENVTVQEPTKGVITTLEEQENGEFDIIDEQMVDSKDASRVIIRRRNGTTDSLTLAQAKSLVQPQDTVMPRQNNQGYNQGYHSHGMGLGGVLWWGSMGYMMGRNFGSPGYSSVYRGGYMPGTNVGDELRRTSVSRTVRMPSSGRSGFFRGFRGGSGG